MLKLLSLTIFVFIFGCASADIVKTTVMPLGGTAQYKNGLLFKEKSRILALEKINEFCKGPYKISKEGFNPDVLSLNVGGTYMTNGNGNFFYIEFVCDK